MKNQNRVFGQMMSSVVKRLKSSGLPAEMIEKAIAAAKGETARETSLLLSAPIRKRLFEIVKSTGPLVITGRKAFKVYTLKSYNSARAHSSANAKKNMPWKNKRRANNETAVVA